jgi:hypothetical protein
LKERRRSQSRRKKKKKEAREQLKQVNSEKAQMSKEGARTRTSGDE